MTEIKIVSPMNRRDLMSRERFAAYYVQQHTQVGGGHEGHYRYVAAPALRGVNGGDPPFDAVAELWFESVEALRRAFVAPMWDRARADFPNMIAGRIMMVAEEHEIIPPPRPGEAVKYVAFVNRSDLMSMQQFTTYWLDKHVPLAIETPGLLGYRASVGLMSANGDSLVQKTPQPAPFDGVVEMWFESVDAFDESFRHAYWDRLREDYASNFVMGRVQLLAREHLIFDLRADAPA